MDTLIIIPVLVQLPLNSPLSASCLIGPHGATCKAALFGTKETLLFQVLIVESAESQAARHDKTSRMNKYYAAGTATFRCVKEDKSRNKARKHQPTKTSSYSNINVKITFICREQNSHTASCLMPYLKYIKLGFGLDKIVCLHTLLLFFFFCRVS